MAGWIDQWRDATVAIGQTQQVEIRYANGRVVNKQLFYGVTPTRIHQIPLMVGRREIGMTFQHKKVPETTLSQNYTGIDPAEPAFRVKELLLSVAKRKRRR